MNKCPVHGFTTGVTFNTLVKHAKKYKGMEMIK